MPERPLKTCVMCGRTELEVPGEWTYGQPDDQTLAEVALSEHDAPYFDPTASYEPITAEKLVLAGCPASGHQRFVIDAGDDVYRCAKCGTVEAAAP